ncbi:MAG: hypothetical protein ACE5GJ_09965 [Gemmatimonadota bacterium]
MRIPSSLPPSGAAVALLLLPFLPHGGAAQSVVVDEGTFAVTLDGSAAGRERFTIRRAGLGRDAVIIAHAEVSLKSPAGTRELRPVLEVSPDGMARAYQLKVTGPGATDVRLNLAGRRYLAVLRTEEGQEEREFLGRQGTRILDRLLAHQYHFLSRARAGDDVPVIEPTGRGQYTLRVISVENARLRVGPVNVQARKMVLGSGAGERTVWFDAQDRVVRVEVPAWGYTAQREDLVG